MTRSNSGSAQVAAPQASLDQKIQFSKPQQNKALFWLVLFHLVVIASSNYLVQIPFTLFGLHTTWGAFTFPFIFLATDLTVRIFGAGMARRIIFWVMLPALAISYCCQFYFFKAVFKVWRN